MNGLIEAIRTNSNDPDPDLLLVRFHLASDAVTVTDLHEPFRAALAAHLPNATAVADAFHVVAVGTRVVDRTRHRVRQETLGHRGHKDDPLYRSRKLLTMAAERLDDRGTTKLRGLLGAGDPDGQVYEAWAVKEGLRDLYTLWAHPTSPAGGSTP